GARPPSAAVQPPRRRHRHDALSAALHGLHHPLEPRRAGSEPEAGGGGDGRRRRSHLLVDHLPAQHPGRSRRRDAVPHPLLRNVHHARAPRRGARHDDLEPHRLRRPAGARLGRRGGALGCAPRRDRDPDDRAGAGAGRPVARGGEVKGKPASSGRFGPVALSAAAWFGYLFMVLPSLIVVPMSFGDKNEFQFPPRAVSLYLYRKYFDDPEWMRATAESLLVAAGATVLALVIGISAAYALARNDFPGKKAVVVFLLSPLFVPSIVIALGLYIYLGELHLVGTTEGLVLAHALITIPFVIITVSSGLRSIDPALERAAYIMGASRLRALVKVTLPLLRPSIAAAALFAFLISFD